MWSGGVSQASCGIDTRGALARSCSVPSSSHDCCTVGTGAVQRHPKNAHEHYIQRRQDSVGPSTMCQGAKWGRVTTRSLVLMGAPILHFSSPMPLLLYSGHLLWSDPLLELLFRHKAQRQSRLFECCPVFMG